MAETLSGFDQLSQPVRPASRTGFEMRLRGLAAKDSEAVKTRAMSKRKRSNSRRMSINGAEYMAHETIKEKEDLHLHGFEICPRLANFPQNVDVNNNFYNIYLDNFHNKVDKVGAEPLSVNRAVNHRRQSLGNATLQKSQPPHFNVSIGSPRWRLPILLVLLAAIQTATAEPWLDTSRRFGDGSSSGLTISQCGSAEQRAILESVPECRIRETLIDLRPLVKENHSLSAMGSLDNLHQIVDVIPSHVKVARCGGGCTFPQYSCQPAGRRYRQIEVMLVYGVWPHGEHQVVCTTLDLVEDTRCECGCEVREEDCRSEDKIYAGCKCLCRNTNARAECLRNNKKFWDPHTCSCSCSPQHFQPCSTGYVFDFMDTCGCVQIGLTASRGLIASIVVVIASLIVIFVAIFLFVKNRRDRQGRLSLTMSGTGTVESSKRSSRTPLMSQKSIMDYDKATSTGKVNSIKEFDELRQKNGIIAEKLEP